MFISAKTVKTVLDTILPTQLTKIFMSMCNELPEEKKKNHYKFITEVLVHDIFDKQVIVRTTDLISFRVYRISEKTKERFLKEDLTNDVCKDICNDVLNYGKIMMIIINYTRSDIASIGPISSLDTKDINDFYQKIHKDNQSEFNSKNIIDVIFTKIDDEYWLLINHKNISEEYSVNNEIFKFVQNMSLTAARLCIDI